MVSSSESSEMENLSLMLLYLSKDVIVIFRILSLKSFAIVFLSENISNERNLKFGME
jgi:hypothetical protein